MIYDKWKEKSYEFKETNNFTGLLSILNKELNRLIVIT
jgi:hypothetical protein